MDAVVFRIADPDVALGVDAGCEPALARDCHLVVGFPAEAADLVALGLALVLELGQQLVVAGKGGCARLLELVEDVLLNRRPDATDRLLVFAETVKQKGKTVKVLGWDPVKKEFGALSFIYGTAVSSFLALLIATPLAIAIALMLLAALTLLPALLAIFGRSAFWPSRTTRGTGRPG